jgi:hypothetical protein
MLILQDNKSKRQQKTATEKSSNGKSSNKESGNKQNSNRKKQNKWSITDEKKCNAGRNIRWQALWRK